MKKNEHRAIEVLAQGLDTLNKKMNMLSSLMRETMLRLEVLTVSLATSGVLKEEDFQKGRDIVKSMIESAANQKKEEAAPQEKLVVEATR